MGIPIKRIVKTITKQVPDVVDDVTTAARIPAQSIKTVTPTSISIPSVTDVFPNQTVINRLGVPIGIGSDVMFDNGKLVGTIFSGDKRYDLSRIYDDFNQAGISSRYLNDWMYNIKQNAGVQEIFKRLPLTNNFQPQLQLKYKPSRYIPEILFTPESYKQLMKSAGYNDDTIRRNIDSRAFNILNGDIISYGIGLDRGGTPFGISRINYPNFTPEHIISNIDEDIAHGIFMESMNKAFGLSQFDHGTNTVKFNYTPIKVGDVEVAASDLLSKKYPGINFDPSMSQFTAENAAQNIPTITFLRSKYTYLPFDFDGFIWTQGKIQPIQWGMAGSRPQTGSEVYKSLGKLRTSVPRGYAITEINTSPDSEVLKLAMVRRNYGTNPGQSSVKIIKERGSRNEMQNNAVWFEDLLNDPQIPQNEKVKLLEIQQKHGISDISPEWYDSETYKRAQTLYHQKAAEDMRKLLDGWRKVKKLDSNIGGVSILVDPFSKYQFQQLFRLGSIAPHIYSPNFHIIKHKNGGSLLNNLQNAIERLKNNNKFGN